ncbi:hypothetical protein HDK64DRAFT_271605 [Phyllosticta capitalensis]
MSTSTPPTKPVATRAPPPGNGLPAATPLAHPSLRADPAAWASVLRLAVPSTKRGRTLIRILCTRTRKTPAFPNRHPPPIPLLHNLSPHLPPLPPSARPRTSSPPPASTAARPSQQRPSRCRIAVPRSIISNNITTTAAPPSPTPWQRQTSTAGPRPPLPSLRRMPRLSRTTMATSKTWATGQVVVMVMARTSTSRPRPPLGSKLHNGGRPCAKGRMRRA